MSCSVRQLVLRHFSHDMHNEAIEKLEKETGQKWYKPTIADDLLINENGDVFLTDTFFKESNSFFTQNTLLSY